MKRFKFFALVGIFLGFLVVEPTLASCRDQTHLPDDESYWVVIGAFAIHKNAIKLTRHASHDLHLDAKFKLNPHRNLYYVYVFDTPNRDAAIEAAKRLRSASEFKDTWVYHGLSDKQSIAGESMAQPEDLHPETGQSISNVLASDQPKNRTVMHSNPPGRSPDNIISPVSTAKNGNSDFDTGVEGKRFYFNIYRATDNDTIQGDVAVIDAERSRKIGTYKGNVPVKITSPSNKSGAISFVCEVFGYRKVQKDIDYNMPAGEGIAEHESGATLIPFELIRLQKGDIAVMYNVYFFKDAAVMRPESRYEVNSLIEMLKENPNYKIRIHGHTNGGAAGKIISMGKESSNFFSLSSTHEGFGSAKKLSEERATVIRNFLVSNEIDPSRMQIKAWGGKRALHDKHSTRAQENVRVEIEILED